MIPTQKNMKKSDKEEVCRFGHECTSRCMNDIECPCQADHCCAVTENCDGMCDDCFNPSNLIEK